MLYTETENPFQSTGLNLCLKLETERLKISAFRRYVYILGFRSLICDNFTYFDVNYEIYVQIIYSPPVVM